MKFFKKMKDGGPNSTVVGYWLIEAKKAFSIVLLKFQGKSREAFHTHAFDSIVWVLKGKLLETRIYEQSFSYRETRRFLSPRLLPYFISKHDFHKVDSVSGDTWVLNIRGPWARTWKEYLEPEDKFQTLSHGRIVVEMDQ